MGKLEILRDTRNIENGKVYTHHSYPQNLLKNAARNSQFDFSLIKLRKLEFPHQRTTWMMLTCVTWLVSPIFLSKLELEEIEFSSACVIANF